jgi:hypothetical protein
MAGRYIDRARFSPPTPINLDSVSALPGICSAARVIGQSARVCFQELLSSGESARKNPSDVTSTSGEAGKPH